MQKLDRTMLTFMSKYTIIKQKKALANGTNRIKKGANQLFK